MLEFGKELKPTNLDWRSTSIEKIQKLLNPERIRKLFPSGAQNNFTKVVTPQIMDLMAEVGLSPTSKEEKDLIVGQICEKIPLGPDAKALDDILERWNAPQ